VAWLLWRALGASLQNLLHRAGELQLSWQRPMLGSLHHPAGLAASSGWCSWTRLYHIAGSVWGVCCQDAGSGALSW
jgi:hypothetical protein